MINLKRKTSCASKVAIRQGKEYDRIVERSETGHTYLYSKESLRLIDRLIPRKGRILDIGCGTGHIEENLRDRKWYGIDISSKSVETARKFFKKVVVGDITKRLPFSSGYFDTVVSFSTLHHVPEKLDDAVKEIWRVLKRGGKLIAIEPDARNIAIKLSINSPFKVVPCVDERALYPGEVRSVLRQNGFKKIRIRTTNLGARDAAPPSFILRLIRAPPNIITKIISRGKTEAFITEAEKGGN